MFRSLFEKSEKSQNCGATESVVGRIMPVPRIEDIKNLLDLFMTLSSIKDAINDIYTKL